MKTFKIESSHEVTEDSWEDGLIDKSVNHYELSGNVDAKNWQEALKNYVDFFLNYDIDMDNLGIDKEDNTINLSFLVDKNNITPSDYEYDLWKEGKFKLYSNDVTIKIFELTEVNLKN